MKPGTHVSRSVYAKLQAENRRLRADIKVMACGQPVDAIQMRIKWRKKFTEDKMFDEAIRAAAKEYMKANPELEGFVKGLKKK